MSSAIPLKKKSKLNSFSSLTKDVESSSSSSKNTKGFETVKSTFKELDSDPYRLTCFKANETKKKKVKSLKMVKSVSRIQGSNSSMKNVLKKHINSLENGEKEKQNNKAKEKIEKKVKNKSLKVANSELNKKISSNSLKINESLKIPLLKISKDCAYDSERSHSQKIQKISSKRLKPKVKDPFHKRIKLEEEFDGESSIRKTPSSNYIQTTDDEEFVKLVNGLRV